MRPSRSGIRLGTLVLTLAFLFLAGLSLRVGAATGPAEDRAGLQPEVNPSPAAGELDKSLEATLFLVPNDLTAISAENATPIHDYGSQRLMAIAHVETLSQATRNRLTSVDDPHSVFYRNCRSSVLPLPAETVATLPDGYYLLALIGPADDTWPKQIASFGVVVVDTAAPYGLVVHATGRQLLGALLSVTTSQGYPVICGIAPIPLETRLSGELLRILKGEQALRDISGLRLDAEGRVAVRLFFFNDPTPGQRPLDHRAAQLAEVIKIARIAPSDLAYGYDDAVLIGGPGDIARILRDIPSVAYMEAIHEHQTDDHAQVYYPIAMAVAPPLYTVRPIVPEATVTPKVMPEEEIPPWINGKDKPGPSAGVAPESSVLQDWVGAAKMPSPITNFEGLGTGLTGFTLTGAPPDTEGDVGPTHYVQWVNSMFAIFNKSTGAVLYGPANGNTLFSSLGGRCASDNNGDPLVMYDKIADRWFMSQFAISASPYYQCVAVSQTNNPVTSPWNLYAFSYGTNFNDYGKGGVWPDGYYMMYHMFANGSTWAGTEVCAFDRVKMLAGQVATQQCFGPNSSYGGLLPSHFQGSTLPPSGSPNYFMAYGTNQLFLWPFHVDWTTPSNTTFPFSTPTTLAVAAFTEACGGTGGTCVPQKGTTNTLDTLGDRLMWRMNYRNFGSYESLVFNHTVTGGAGTGVRWYEIRNPSTTPVVFQQGTFAPSDTTWRWMGSVNMDMMGDIAAGYSGSSSTMNPSLIYTGRLVTDTPGTFPQGEATLFAGTGSQTGTLTRWGDYSTMSVDPTDDCTFWFTSEYLSANGTFNWRTRIGSFKFPSCGCAVPGAPSQNPVSIPGSNQLQVNWSAGSPAGATYKIFRSTGACPGGVYTLVKSGQASSPWIDTTVNGGVTYAYKVSAVDTTGGCESAQSACQAGTATGSCVTPPTYAGLATVTANPNATCTLNLSWATATANCGGPITYRVYRSTTAGFTPGPTNLIASGIATLTYADVSGLTPATTYYYVVRAVDGTNGAEDTNVTQKSGSPLGLVTTPVSENFEEAGAQPTSGGTWAHNAAQGTDNWLQSTSGNPHSPTHTFFSTDASSLKDDYLITPTITLSAGSTMTFWHTYQLESNYDGAVIEISTNGGTTYTDLGPKITSGGYNGTISANYSSPIAGRQAWTGGSVGTETQVVVDLSSYSGNVKIRFRLACDSSVGSTGWYVDDVIIQSQLPCSTSCSAPSAPSLTSATGTCSGVTLNWMAGAGITNSYSVYRSSTTVCPAGTLAKLNTSPIPAGTLTYNDTTAVAGTAYTYVVRGACDAGGTTESANSNCLQAARLAAPAAPTAPTFSNVGCTALTVNWTASSGAITYDVYRMSGATCTGAAKITASPVAGTSYADPGLTAGAPYSYYVVANNACGSSANGTCGSQTTLAAAYCSTPTETAPGNTLATAQTWSDKNTQMWPAVTGAQTYNIYYGLLGDLPALTSTAADSCLHGTVATNSDASFTENPTGKAGGFYWYLITAVNLAGEGTAGTYNTTGTPTPRIVNLKASGSCPP